MRQQELIFFLSGEKIVLKSSVVEIKSNFFEVSFPFCEIKSEDLRGIDPVRAGSREIYLRGLLLQCYLYADMSTWFPR